VRLPEQALQLGFFAAGAFLLNSRTIGSKLSIWALFKVPPKGGMFPLP
jgi:hypothetical protein